MQSPPMTTEPLELVRETSSTGRKSRPPSPHSRRKPSRRSSSHSYHPHWLVWIKPPNPTRGFSLSSSRSKTPPAQRSKDVDDEGVSAVVGAQTSAVPEPDATSDIPPVASLGSGSASASASDHPPPNSPRHVKRHSSGAWSYIHSIVTTISSPSTRSTPSYPSSPTTPATLLAMPAPSAGQGSPATATVPLPGGRAATIPLASPSDLPSPPTLSVAIPESPAPPSAHDAVVNKLLQRPQFVHRSNSSPAPAEPSLALHRTLSAEDPKTAPASPPLDERAESRSVSAMMNGPLDAGGGRVTRALASQIEAVLTAQAEIGRAHLALEGIGVAAPAGAAGLNLLPEEGGEGGEEGGKGAEAVAADEADLARRQAGVEEIMARLSELATSLKSYHAMGTPALIFPPTLPRRPVTAPSPNTSKPRMPIVTIATPEVARNVSLQSSTDSLPVPESRTAFSTTPSPGSVTSAAATPTSPIGPSAAGGRTPAPKGAALWLRKTATNAAAVAVDSPMEMKAGEHRRPW